MNVKLAKNILLTSAIGALGYLGYSSFINNKSHFNESIEQSTTALTLKDNIHKDLDMNLNDIESVNTTSEAASNVNSLVINENTIPQASIEEEIIQAAAIEEVIETPEQNPIETPPLKPIEPKKFTEAKKQAPEPIKHEKPSKQAKLDKFAKNMEGIQKQAEDEWSKMSSEEQAETEEQVELFQHNFQSEIERLSHLSPEEVEMEKQAAMAKLEIENPEAYQAVRSMEDMFMDLADATE